MNVTLNVTMSYPRCLSSPRLAEAPITMLATRDDPPYRPQPHHHGLAHTDRPMTDQQFLGTWQPLQKQNDWNSKRCIVIVEDPMVVGCDHQDAVADLHVAEQRRESFFRAAG
jgi:hypothetical protein